MKKLLALAAIVALLAPALAVCAGATTPATSKHDCCPKEEMTAGTMAPSASMTESCCTMSDEASQRVPSPTSQNLASTTPVAAPPPAWFHTVSSNTPAMHVHTAPASVDHVPRHLLLSVLIV